MARRDDRTGFTPNIQDSARVPALTGRIETPARLVGHIRRNEGHHPALPLPLALIDDGWRSEGVTGGRQGRHCNRVRNHQSRRLSNPLGLAACRTAGRLLGDHRAVPDSARHIGTGASRWFEKGETSSTPPRFGDTAHRRRRADPRRATKEPPRSDGRTSVVNVMERFLNSSTIGRRSKLGFHIESITRLSAPGPRCRHRSASVPRDRHRVIRDECLSWGWPCSLSSRPYHPSSGLLSATADFINAPMEFTGRQRGRDTQHLLRGGWLRAIGSQTWSTRVAVAWVDEVSGSVLTGPGVILNVRATPSSNRLRSPAVRLPLIFRSRQGLHLRFFSSTHSLLPPARAIFARTDAVVPVPGGKHRPQA